MVTTTENIFNYRFQPYKHNGKATTTATKDGYTVTEFETKNYKYFRVSIFDKFINNYLTNWFMTTDKTTQYFDAITFFKMLLA